MTQKALPFLALLAALTLAAGCESFEDATGTITEGVRDLGNAIGSIFEPATDADDPLNQCRAAGHETGTPAYKKCLADAVAEQCARYGDVTSEPYRDCVAYYDDLDMVRRQTRIYGYTR